MTPMAVQLSLRTALLLGVALFTSATSARADSDGYYCAGPNYIAYELSLSLREGTHRLYVIPLSDSGGIGHPARIELPDFQVHGMRCGSGFIELLGWDSLYTVRVQGAERSLTASVALWTEQGATRQASNTYPSTNLGAWSRAAKAGQPDTVRLAIHTARPRFILAMDVRANPGDACSYKVQTRLVELDQAGRPVHALTLFEGAANKECGE